MRIIDLFAGLCGWTSAADPDRDVVVTTDIDERFGTTVTADILEPDLGDRLIDALGGRPDVVLASPPCEAFTVMQIGRNWTGPTDIPPHAPKTERAVLALRIVERTRELLDELAPSYFVIENPRAKLRKLPVMAGLERRTVTYCQLGEPFMKPTDLWGGFPPSLVLPPPCRNGDPCHVTSPRGSTTGIQGSGAVEIRCPACGLRTPSARRSCGGCGLPFSSDQLRRIRNATAAERAKVPFELSRLVLEAARSDLDSGRNPIVGQSSLW